MVNSSKDTIVEEREELMVSPTSGYPTYRTAHFLKPSVTSIDGPVSNLPSRSLLCSAPNSETKKPPLKVSFSGWKYPQKDWKTWVDRMHSLYQTVWKQAGIHDAVLNSAYIIKRDNSLFLGFAERWCSETKTFVFPWGEASITLEDMMGLGGYSVLGDSVSVCVSLPLGSKEMEIEDKLIQARQDFTRIKSQNARQSKWMAKFINSGSQIEHEAFLALWLSRFVFPFEHKTLIGKHLFPISIKLARGIKLALAPAVLANIYRDLSFLKEKIVASNKLGTSECEVEVAFAVAVCSPLQFVQIWAWERFPTLRPKPNPLESGHPRFARWHNLNKTGTENVRLAIDSASEDFHWRPYAMTANHSMTFKFYKEKEEWVSVDSRLDEELESFARCLRASELVGLECIEQYLPHRVSMQFGMDQDLPGRVARANKTPEIAWNNYTRPILDAKLYISSRLFESDVTARYLEWWKQSYGGKKAIKGVEKKKRRCKSLKTLLAKSSPKRCRTKVGDSVDENELTLAESARNLRPRNGKASNGESEAEQEEAEGSAVDENRAESVMVHNMVSMVDNKGESDIQELELEARICKLEKLVDQLKTAKLGRTFC